MTSFKFILLASCLLTGLASHAGIKRIKCSVEHCEAEKKGSGYSLKIKIIDYDAGNVQSVVSSIVSDEKDFKDYKINDPKGACNVVNERAQNTVFACPAANFDPVIWMSQHREYMCRSEKADAYIDCSESPKDDGKKQTGGVRQ